MNTELPLVLIGPMAAGKTCVGRALAQALNYSFFDSDAWIEQTTGKTIASLFSELGEPGFRQLEADCIKNLLKPNTNFKQVIATGGGVLSSPGIADYLSMHSYVILLLIQPEEQWRRIQVEQQAGQFGQFGQFGQNTRPLAISLEQLKILYASRLPVYLGCADLVINCIETQTPQELAQEIAQEIIKNINNK
jgi:shikimate kinase